MKICILSSGRAGTTLLHKTLCTHPDIRPAKCNEPFAAILHSFEYYLPFIKDELHISFDDKIGQPFPNSPPVIRSKDDIYKYLDYVFENEDIVKILYDQIEYNVHILSYLVDHPEIKIINLYRIDTMGAYLSLLKLKHWITTQERIWISEEHYQNFVDKWEIMRKIINIFLSDRVLDISFEDLISNWHDVIARVLKHIDVFPHRLAMAITREEYVPPEYYIHNPQLIAKLRQKLTDKDSYLFTEYLNVFQYAKPLFEKFLQPYIGKEAHFLEIGSFEGRSSNWMTSYILTHPKSTLTCVDIWIYTWLTSIVIPDFFTYNMGKFGDKIAIYRCLSGVVLPKFLAGRQYDFIYIDGSHVDKDMLEDTNNSYALLKPGGIIAIDDYNLVHDEYTKGTIPKILLDQFLEQHASEIEILHKDFQLWFRKR